MSLTTFRNWFFCTLACMALQSCILDKDDKDVITEVQDEFKVGMIEVLGNNRQLAFELASIEMEPCLNSSIDRRVVVGNNRVSVLLNGIVPASDCNPGSAPATAVGNVGKLTILDYDFDIILRGTVVNEGKLEVDHEKYIINLATTNGIVIEEPVLYKIPDNSIWGYVAYNDETLAGNHPSDFLSDLSSLAQTKYLPTGQYGHFKVLASGDIQLRETLPQKFVTTFYFQFTGDKNDLANLLESYRSGPAGGMMELAVHTSEGEVF